jgi:cation diffusion facilitator CzcD-associated flavoprotein CzcO
VKGSSKSKVIIVGGGKFLVILGAGGLVAAETLRSEGYNGTVTILSREDYLPINRFQDF